MIAESVPAADATVWTMLFSRIDESFTALRMAIEITAAGNRRGEGEADLEAEVDVGRREDRRDERAENQAAEGEFFGFHGPHITSSKQSTTMFFEQIRMLAVQAVI